MGPACSIDVITVIGGRIFFDFTSYECSILILQFLVDKYMIYLLAYLFFGLPFGR
jgi:hypothetical protein